MELSTKFTELILFTVAIVRKDGQVWSAMFQLTVAMMACIIACECICRTMSLSNDDEFTDSLSISPA